MGTTVILIPAFNEEKTIGSLIQQTELIDNTFQVLVVDDGSTDKTVEICKEAGAIVISNNINRGVGYSFRRGIDKAISMNADYVITIDADGQMNPKDIPKILNMLRGNKCDVVIANRDYSDKDYTMPWIKKWGNKYLTNFLNSITGYELKDAHCGFRGYNREALLRLHTFGDYTYTQESIINLAREGLKIEQIKLEIKPQREGESRLVKNVFDYGFKTSVIILRTVRDNAPLKFFGIPGLVMVVSAFIIFFVKLIMKGFGIGFLEHPWLMFGSGLFLVLGVLFIIIALLADMIGNVKELQKKTLYEIRK